MEEHTKKNYNIHSVNNKQYIKKIQLLCNDSPWYIKGYASSDILCNLSPATQYAYLFSITQYVEHLHHTEERYSQLPYYKIPVSIFDIDPQQLETYLLNMQSNDQTNGLEKSNSPLYHNRILAAFRSFYSYLHKSTLLDYECPVHNVTRKKVVRQLPFHISSKDIDRLIEGIKKNDRYLLTHTDDSGNIISEIISIPNDVLLRRQRSIKRNVAIIRLIYDLGLSVAETAGLDVSCIDWTDHTISITVNEGNSKILPCMDKTMQALHEYLHTPDIPDSILRRQSNRHEFLNFCRGHMTDPNAASYAEKKFLRHDERFLTDITVCCTYLRESGRKSYFPHPYDDALFLSNRSRRISVRMIEQMVTDMTKTYLPNLSEDRNISPTVLRLAAHNLC